MFGAYKVHLHESSLKLIELSSETVKNILRNVKYIIFVVNKSINYLFFRFYSTEELMVNADSTMRAARNKRSEQEQQFMIPPHRRIPGVKMEHSTRRESFVSSLDSLRS